MSFCQNTAGLVKGTPATMGNGSGIPSQTVCTGRVLARGAKRGSQRVEGLVALAMMPRTFLQRFELEMRLSNTTRLCTPYMHCI